ncbi:MAG: glycosyltransferase family 4 protein [Patescibacteria group bacterium]
MKILFGITKSNFGGAQKYVFDLATETKKLGHDVSVVCGGNGMLVNKLKKEGIRVINLVGMERDVRLDEEVKSFFEILRILRKEKPDVFHINSSKMGGAGALAARIAGIKKIIFTAHGWAFNEERPRLQKLIIEKLAWLTVFLSHKTICVSERLRLDMINKPFIKGGLVVINNGIEEFKLLSQEIAREKLDIKLPENSVLVGTLSELHYTKGLDIALRAINKTPENVHLAIFGDGEAKRELQNLSKNLGLSERVRFFGFVDDAPKYLRAFDIFTLTSRTEGLPYVLLEAGLAELPVVTSNVGGIPEIIKDKETGMLVPKENPKILAEIITKLSNNVEERKRLGENLKKSVVTNFSKQKMVEKTLSLYQ